MPDPAYTYKEVECLKHLQRRGFLRVVLARNPAPTETDTMAGLARHTIVGSTCISLTIVLAFAQIPTASREINGRVIDRTGAGVANATLVASGVGFNGWASTGADGSFRLKAAGLFVSIRHPGMKALLIRTSDLSEPARIELEEAGVGARKMPSCGASSRSSEKLVGGGLKVNPGRGRIKGPVYGEHDSHWYLRFRKDTLHIVDGYAWHAGLPSEERLARSENTSIRSWEFEGFVGLDVSGKTGEGKRWRWIGAPLSDAIEYAGVTSKSADYFDKILESTCFASIAPPRK